MQILDNKNVTRKTIEGGEETFFEIKKSKFISKALNVNSKTELEDVLNKIKTQYKDASHCCYAYDVESLGKGFCDDGEPSGTSGKPILNVIEKNNLSNTLIVVIRYFGGIKLGAGPLTRAYSNSATMALKNSTTKQLKKVCKIRFDVGFEKIFEIYKLSLMGLFCVENNVENGFEVVCELKNKDEVLREIENFNVLNLKYNEVWM